MKVRHVPCLCPACLDDDGQECQNSHFADPWKLVHLKPKKGDNPRKHVKRKRPDSEDLEVRQKMNCTVIDIEDSSDDEDLLNMEFDYHLETTTQTDLKNCKHIHVPSGSHGCSWKSVAEDIVEEDFNINDSDPEIIENENLDQTEEAVEVCEKTSAEFRLSGENVMLLSYLNPTSIDTLLKSCIPQWAYWGSILTVMHNCTSFETLEKVAKEINERLPPLPPRKDAYFVQGTDKIDVIAMNELPKDGPDRKKFTVVMIKGDGNCLCRSASKGYFNTDSRHLELRARIVIEGIINKKKYITEECLE